MKNEMIAKVLKELRKQNSLTVHDVVLKLSDKAINVADKTLYGWESGQAQPIPFLSCARYIRLMTY